MIEKIKAYSSVFTGVFSAMVVLFGVFRFIAQGNENAKAIQVISAQVEEIKEFQQSPIVRLDSIEMVLNSVNATVRKTNSKLDVISRQFNQHLSHDKSITKEELMQIMYEQNEKKNSEINNINWYDTIEPAIKIRKIPKK